MFFCCVQNQGCVWTRLYQTGLLFLSFCGKDVDLKITKAVYSSLYCNVKGRVVGFLNHYLCKRNLSFLGANGIIVNDPSDHKSNDCELLSADLPVKLAYNFCTQPWWAALSRPACRWALRESWQVQIPQLYVHRKLINLSHSPSLVCNPAFGHGVRRCCVQKASSSRQRPLFHTPPRTWCKRTERRLKTWATTP